MCGHACGPWLVLLLLAVAGCVFLLFSSRSLFVQFSFWGRGGQGAKKGLASGHPAKLVKGCWGPLAMGQTESPNKGTQVLESIYFFSSTKSFCLRYSV